jgi:thioredoxin 2
MTQGQAARSDPAARADIITCSNCAARNRVSAAQGGTPRCGRCHKPLPWITSAGDNDFEEVVTRSSLPVLLDMWAPWCAPCRIVEPGVERAAQTHAGRLKAVKVNVDTAPRVSERYAARSIPMLLLVRNGEVKGKQVGAVGPDKLLSWVESSLAAA